MFSAKRIFVNSDISKQTITESEYNRKFIKGSLPSIEEEKKTEDNNNESP